jgi:hypothetical protein
MSVLETVDEPVLSDAIPRLSGRINFFRNHPMKGGGLYQGGVTGYQKKEPALSEVESCGVATKSS